MFLELRQLDIQYPGSPTPAVQRVNLGLRSGDIGVLIGPSGCGKTTLLRAVAGLEPVSGGQILLSNRVVSEKGHTEPAERRRIGMVFQDYALFPHMDVGHNVGFGLAHLTKAERQQRVAEVLTLVGLEGSDRRFPHELSGGQQQRVYLAQVLARRADLLLLDEPTAGLDAPGRAAYIDALSFEKNRGAAVVTATHDVGEASMCDRVLLLAGRVIADGPPNVVMTPENLLETFGIGLTKVGDQLVVTEHHHDHHH